MFLLSNGANPNAINKDGIPLIVYVYDPEYLRVLIAAGADVNACDRFGRTALIAAVSSCSMERARLLLQCPEIDLDACMKNGETAFTVSQLCPGMLAMLKRKRARCRSQSWW